MKFELDKLIISATDLSNYLACAHLSELNRQVAQEGLKLSYYLDPVLEILRQRGYEHEANYVKHLEAKGLKVINLKNKPQEDTLLAMKAGFDVIVQARFENSEWKGFPDILLKIPKPSNLGNWSYEVQDTKLSQHTRAGTILQLCFYSEFLDSIQGTSPELMYVVKPGNPFIHDDYRYNDFKAYYNLIKKGLLKAVQTPPQTYPDPVEHCKICSYWQLCAQRRRDDDHLSLVAGIRSSQIVEFINQDINTLTKLARTHEIKRPERGDFETLKKKQDQARIQLAGLEEKRLKYTMLPVPAKTEVKENGFATSAEHGLSLLPEPSEGDIYFDFEGDAFYEGGSLEYLFGYVYKNGQGEYVYSKIWARDRQEERRVFQKFMEFVMNHWKKYPGMCIYHFAPYEPSALKRLMRTHGLYEAEVNKILRGLRFVDLHTVIKRSLIASVERYSLKDLEHLARYTRVIPLRDAGAARRRVECALELGDFASISDVLEKTVDGYNEDDCRATLALHLWLEERRKELIKSGETLTRLELNDGEAKEDAKKRGEEIERIVNQLTKHIPEDRTTWSDEEKAKWFLSHQLEYFKREDESSWWEYYATREKDEEDLKNDRKAIVGLTFVKSFPLTGKQIYPIEQYRFDPQEVDIRPRDTLTEIVGDHIGDVVAISLENWTIDIKKTGESLAIRPHSVQVRPASRSKQLAESLIKFAESVVENGLGDNFPYPAARDLLVKSKPRLKVSGPLQNTDEKLVETAIRVGKALKNSVLAIQGPPGTGKTYTGAEMIVALTKEKKKIGITAVSHKVIRNLLVEVGKRAEEAKFTIALAHRSNGEMDSTDHVEELGSEKDALTKALAKGAVVGGTAWVWAPDSSEGLLDYLFVDEAGQMSLAYVLAASRCARNIILLGDPIQLEQPQRGTHPEGSGVAALEHLLDGHKTMPTDRGLFINTTRRLHPDICAFTSELFYEGKLESFKGLEDQLISGPTQFRGSGLFYVPVNHSGCQTKSPKEIEAVVQIVDDLRNKGEWEGKKLGIKEILIVAPYNAQVNALKLALPEYKIGTVDKFQGQEAPVVIYSMTASSPEDVPRGMSFLYNPNRFNVASSRALSVCILVASPKLLEPNCRTIDQMKWANVLCRYKEMAREIHL